MVGLEKDQRIWTTRIFLAHDTWICRKKFRKDVGFGRFTGHAKYNRANRTRAWQKYKDRDISHSMDPGRKKGQFSGRHGIHGLIRADGREVE